MIHRFPAAATLALAVSLGAAQAAEKLPGPYPARVLRVVDGDTLEVEVAVWLDVRVKTDLRIDGIDTPEVRGKCQREKDRAAEATATTTRLAGASVTLFDVQHDKYAGRARARVATADGRDLGTELIRAGLARPYGGEARETWCTITVVPRR